MKHTLLVFALFLCAGCINDQGDDSVEFGAPYGIGNDESLPVIVDDSLFVSVNYSGCNGHHDFSLEYRVVGEATAEVWLRKLTPGQMCQAYFQEERSFHLPEAVLRCGTVVLLTREGKRIPLRHQELYGSWTWAQSSGGIAGITLTPPPSGRIEFTRNGDFRSFRSDTLLIASMFTIRRERTSFSPDVVPVIHYRDSLRLQPQIYRIRGDSLFLTDLCIDCFSHLYLRPGR